MPNNLAKFNVEPKRASGDELMTALLACQTGVATPTVQALMNHIAWLQKRVEQCGGTTRMSD